MVLTGFTADTDNRAGEIFNQIFPLNSASIFRRAPSLMRIYSATRRERYYRLRFDRDFENTIRLFAEEPVALGESRDVRPLFLQHANKRGRGVENRN